MDDYRPAVKPGGKCKVLVDGQAYPMTTNPDLWIFDVDDATDAGAEVYVNPEELLPPDTTSAALRRAHATEAFARWVVALDDPSGPGFEARKRVTLNEIIKRARIVLDLPEAS